MTTKTESPAGRSTLFAGARGRTFSKAKPIAARLGICPWTLFRWANDGKIVRHKINARVVLFDDAEVIAFIESARAGVNTRSPLPPFEGLGNWSGNGPA
jgi:hypothetical protein